MTSELILLVCAANVCRSPLAELLLRDGLGAGLDVRIASAGTMTSGGSEICSLVEQFREDAAWGDEARAHRSVRIEPGMLEQAALILVASRDVRSEVVRSVPEVRGRTYTLREAAYLGNGFDPATQPRHLGTVARYAAHLDRSRVVRGSVPTGRRGWRPGRHDDGPDVIDGHGRSRWAHRGAITQVAEATASVVRQLGGTAS